MKVSGTSQPWEPPRANIPHILDVTECSRFVASLKTKDAQGAKLSTWGQCSYSCSFVVVAINFQKDCFRVVFTQFHYFRVDHLAWPTGCGGDVKHNLRTDKRNLSKLLNVWMSERLNVCMSACLNVRMSLTLHGARWYSDKATDVCVPDGSMRCECNKHTNSAYCTHQLVSCFLDKFFKFLFCTRGERRIVSSKVEKLNHCQLV